MNNESQKPLKIRQILVALDASSHSLAALEAAMRLARSLEARVEGLFVEDIDWFRVSRLSSTREISELTGTIRPLGEQAIEKQVRAIARRMERALRVLGENSEVMYNFRSVRGSVESQLLEASEKADLITIGRVGKSVTRGKRLGKTARTLLNNVKKPILILQHGLKLGDTIAVMYDQSEVSRQVLQVAKDLAVRNGSRIDVIAHQKLAEDSEALKEELKEQVKDTNVKVRLFLMKTEDVLSVAQTVNSERGGLLIAPRAHSLFRNTNLESMLQHIKCPLLLI